MPDGDSSSSDGERSPLERMGSPEYRRANSTTTPNNASHPTDSFVAAQIGTLMVDKPKQGFDVEVAAMRAHIHRQRSRVYTTHRYLSYLDIVVGSCVLFVSLISPVDVTMTSGASANFVFLVGLFCNLVFLIDLVVRFNRAYRDDSANGGRWVRDRSLIARRYMRSWFVIDVVAVIPLDVPFVLGMIDPMENAFQVKVINLLRLVRCLKIIQVMPVVLHVMLTRLAMTNSTAELIKFSILIGLTVHYLACFWAFVGLNWEPTEGSTAVSETTWIAANNMENYALHRLYAVSIYVSIVAIFGGVSSVAPQNFVEYCALSGMMLVGGLVWAYVLSMLCAIFSKLDPRETEHKNMMDELSYFMDERDFEPEHRQRLRDFFNYTKDFAREGGYAQIFERMSNKLRADTALLMGEAHVQWVWYLRRDKVENEFLCEVALNLRAAVYEIHENLPIKKLTVISRGLVAQRMRLIGAGKVLGIDCILKEQHSGLRELDTVMCLSFVHVATISRDTLFELADDYPQARDTLQMASRHMTVRAAMVHYYKNFVRHNRKLPGRSGVDEISAELMFGKKLGSKNRRGSAAFLSKSFQHHDNSKAVESQLNELKAMVASLAAAQASPNARDSSTMPRRRNSVDKHNSSTRPDSTEAKRSSTRSASASGGRGTKEAPGRSRQLDSKSRRGDSRRDLRSSVRSSGYKLSDALLDA